MSEGEGETLHQSHLVIAPVCRCTAEVLKPSSIVCVFGVCSGWISIKTMSRGGQHRSSGERRICRDSETRGAAGGMGHDRKTVGNHFVWANDWLCFLFLTCIKSCLACALGYGCLMLFENLVCCSLVTFFWKVIIRKEIQYHGTGTEIVISNAVLCCAHGRGRLSKFVPVLVHMIKDVFVPQTCTYTVHVQRGQ